MALRLSLLLPLVLFCAFNGVCSVSCDPSSVDPSRDFFPDKVAAQFSSYWSVRYENSYKVVTVSAPNIFPSWQPSGVFYNSTYVLVACGSEPPSASIFPEGTRFFNVPISRYALDSTTQAIHAEVLGELDSLVAYGSSSTPTSPCFQRRRASFAQIESWFGANETRRAEQIAALNLDAQFSWPRLPHPRTVSVPETSDPSVLGRAEWVKFWSLWFNKEDIANRVFDGIVERWECHQGAVRSLLSRSSTRSPRVAWISHTASSVTFIQADFVLDYLRAAGADVVFQSSVQPNVVSNSTALVLLKDVDVLIDDGGRFTSYSLLLSRLGLNQDSTEYPWIQNRQVWTHDALRAPDGSTAWFESHLVEPDVMLEDLISIFFPRYQPNYRRTWFRNIAAVEILPPRILTADDCPIGVAEPLWFPTADECSGFDGPCDCNQPSSCPPPTGFSDATCATFGHYIVSGALTSPITVGSAEVQISGDFALGSTDQLIFRPGGVALVSGRASLAGSLVVDLARVPYARVIGLSLQVLTFVRFGNRTGKFDSVTVINPPALLPAFHAIHAETRYSDEDRTQSRPIKTATQFGYVSVSLSVVDTRRQQALSGCVANFDPSIDYFPTKVSVSHATLFKVEYFNHFKVVTSTDTQGATETYVLTLCGAPRPTQAPPGAKHFTIPLDRVAITSTTHIPYLEILNARSTIVASTSNSFTTSPCVKQLQRSGLLLPFESSNSTARAEQIESMRIGAWFGWGARPSEQKYVSVSETAEPSLLGRGEWVKFFAAFLNREVDAMEHFEEVEDRAACHSLSVSFKDSVRPTVAWFEARTWLSPVTYAVSVSNFSREAIRSAGGNPVSGLVSSTNDLKRILKNVDVLIDANYFAADTLQSFFSSIQLSAAEIASGDYPFASRNQIWRFDKLQGPDGGYDYWESALAEPDVFLEDLISILHPSYNPRHRAVWLRNWALGESVVRTNASDCRADPLFGEFEPRADECTGIVGPCSCSDTRCPDPTFDVPELIPSTSIVCSVDGPWQINAEYSGGLNVGDNEIVFKRALAFSPSDTVRLSLGGIVLAEDSADLGGATVVIDLENEDTRRLDKLSIPIVRARFLIGSFGRVSFMNVPFGGNPQWELQISPQGSSSLRTVSVSLGWSASARPAPLAAPLAIPVAAPLALMPSPKPVPVSQPEVISAPSVDSNLSVSTFSPTGFIVGIVIVSLLLLIVTALLITLVLRLRSRLKTESSVELFR